MKLHPQKNFWFSLIVITALVFSCTPDKEEIEDLQNFIPENADFIVQSPDLSTFLATIDSTRFFTENPSLFENFNFPHLQNLNRLSPLKETLVVFVEAEEDQYLLITRDSLQVKTDSVQNRSRETLKYDDFEIQKIGTDNLTTFIGNRQGVFLASNSRNLLELALKNDLKRISSRGFEMAWAAADVNKTSLFIDNNSFDKLFDNFFPATGLALDIFGSWSVLDLETRDHNLVINGILSLEEKSAELMDVFHQVPPQRNRLAEITPTSASGFYSFTYSNFGSLFNNLKTFRKDSVEISENNILNFTKEGGIIYSEEKVLAFTTNDPELAMESLLPTEKVSDFRGIEIFKASSPNQFSELLSPLLIHNEIQFYAFLEDFLIFSGSPEGIEGIITNFQNGSTLSNQPYYQEAVADLAGASSLLFVSNNTNFKSALGDNASVNSGKKEEILNFKEYPITAFQLVQDQNFAHLHGILKMSGGQTSEGIRQLASVELKAAVGTIPVLVKNHDTNELEILVQDVENVLYLYDVNGKMQWSKKFTSRITSPIVQVDIFRNGNLQYIFNTPNALHVLDKNGNPVKPFPLEFKDEITQPISVFDYDNNRKYRFVVTQKNNLLMYDSRGKIVRGFNFSETDSPISQSPKHLRLRNKDYIIFSEENGKINILSRQGKPRIQVKEKTEISENEWYEHKRNFVSANSAGQLVFVDENGKVDTKGKATETSLKLVATEQLLVSLSENILKINDKEITLDYGLYTAPSIFNLKGKSYIGITDTQASRLLIFNEDAELLPGFPVYGTSKPHMTTGKNNSMQITVKGDENSVLVYEM